MNILLEAAPPVEPTSIDDVFADVTILRDPSGEIPRDIQRRVNTEIDLPCSLGGGTSKLVAKLANTFGKTRQPKDKPPNSIMIVPPGEEKLFLEDLPVGKARIIPIHRSLVQSPSPAFRTALSQSDGVRVEYRLD